MEVPRNVRHLTGAWERNCNESCNIFFVNNSCRLRDTHNCWESFVWWREIFHFDSARKFVELGSERTDPQAAAAVQKKDKALSHSFLQQWYKLLFSREVFTCANNAHRFPPANLDTCHVYSWLLLHCFSSFVNETMQGIASVYPRRCTRSFHVYWFRHGFKISSVMSWPCFSVKLSLVPHEYSRTSFASALWTTRWFCPSFSQSDGSAKLLLRLSCPSALFSLFFLGREFSFCKCAFAQLR